MSVVLDLDCVNIHSEISLIFDHYNYSVKGNLCLLECLFWCTKLHIGPSVHFMLPGKFLQVLQPDNSLAPEQGEGAHCGGLGWLLLLWCQT